MQLVHLSLEAIGPFPGREEIDFARLGAAGLFLIEGPTGSGKTTIIDAVTFALYGRVAQASADPERIHSHHADPRTQPWVRLVFETQAGVYVVRRTPAFMRPKVRGTSSGGVPSLTKVQPTVKLWRYTSVAAALDESVEGDLISTSMGDAEDQITRAVGLKHGQFVQTVVLPQGEFARFLRAKSEEKAELLERVFGTQFFRRVQQELIEAGHAADHRRRAAAEDIAEAITSFGVAAGLDDAAAEALRARGASDPGCLGPDLKAVLADLARAEKVSSRAAKDASERRRQVGELVNETRLRAERFRRLQDLQSREEALARRAPAIAALRGELDAALQAQPVAGAIRTKSTADQGVRRAGTALTACRRALPVALRDEDTATWREALTTHRDVLAELAHGLRAETDLNQVDRSLDACVRQRQREQKTLDDVLARSEAVPRERAALEESLGTARTEAARVDDRSAALARAGDRLEAATALVAATRLAGTRESEAAAALADHSSALRALDEVNQARIAGIAGELGLTLRDGSPCPVCGSTDHPVPARPSPDAVTEETVTAHERRAHDARESSETARNALEEARGRVRELAARAEGRAVDAATREESAARDALRTSEAARREVPRLEERIARALEQERAAREEGEARRQALARLGQQLEDLGTRRTELANTVTTARGEFASVTQRRAHVADLCAALEGALQAHRDHELAQESAARAEDELRRDLEQFGLESLERCIAAQRDSAWIARARTEIKTYDDDLTRVRAGLSSPEYEDIQEPELFLALDQLELTEQQTIAEDAARAEELGRARERLEHARARVEHIHAAIEAGGHVTAETADAVRVGLLAAGNGDNQRRMDLAKYVLIRRFTEVLRVANLELARFSSGRYALEHTDEKDGNRKSGLGMRIHDVHTGQVRDVGTLSGGETFYVSLALALALAEVVRAENGGVDLGTLFVDEGFGTLDPEVLDDVMQTLEGLKDEGRTVGIISHVAELKGRVAERIEVQRRPDQSSTLRVVVG